MDINVSGVRVSLSLSPLREKEKKRERERERERGRERELFPTRDARFNIMGNLKYHSTITESGS